MKPIVGTNAEILALSGDYIGQLAVDTTNNYLVFWNGSGWYTSTGVQLT